MKLGLVYDLRDDYLARGFTEEETAEFDAKETIDALAGSFKRLGWDVVPVGCGQDLARRFAADERFDLVFSIAEGLKGRSREAQVPALCEMFDQPYVFSDPLTMAVTLDKGAAKRIVRDANVPTADFDVIANAEEISATRRNFPLFLKPLAEGTGKGCGGRSRVENEAELKGEAARLIVEFRQPVLVESYLPGREFTVGILGNAREARVIGVMEIIVATDTDKGAYSLAVKENWEEHVTLSLADDIEARLAGARALDAYHELGCRDAARVDMKSDGFGSPQFLEVNPIAGLRPDHSDLPMLAEKAGLSYDALIGGIVAAACVRQGIPLPRGHRRQAA
ncbi:MAG: D-alanine--D-alanine ligase [Alphaproteobacteria bacterium]|nr:MAG: D-alanine--D-alanine ligase [Alphaproteobacteria bacterium]